ncbi:COMM domain-containing protein 9-like [Elysia marginata]|uniref:COMM domain-containing protein 9-like n=1 Tax=Elysia marginata TaxID=1093978 RepID=A0AAV4EL70_9GAST|nr:COMM domain-containing protein 9-like [Elysia marginata]
MVQLCQQAFLYRKRGAQHLPEALVKDVAQTLGVSPSETRQCISTLGHLLKTAVFEGSADPQDIFALFPGGFHKNLRDLLTKIIIDNMEKWQSDSITGQGRLKFCTTQCSLHPSSVYLLSKLHVRAMCVRNNMPGVHGESGICCNFHF